MMLKGRFRITKHISQKLLVEIIIRIALLLLFIQMEHLSPFKRKIHPDEIWLYRNPKTLSFVPARVLWPLGILIPLTVFGIFYLTERDWIDFIQATLGVTLSMGLNGVLTDMLKLFVGRPRPDYFWRCFPNGEMNTDMECTGDAIEIRDGRKSFPSGHASFAFASLGFLTLYLLGKFHVFGENGRGQSWRLCASLLPTFLALAIAVSRTCDYHHHWQDVLVGSIIGISIAYLCYRQYYPSLETSHSHRSYVQLCASSSLSSSSGRMQLADGAEICGKIDETSRNTYKWI